jgi:hypothetical protein
MKGGLIITALGNNASENRKQGKSSGGNLHISNLFALRYFMALAMMKPRFHESQTAFTIGSLLILRKGNMIRFVDIY